MDEEPSDTDPIQHDDSDTPEARRTVLERFLNRLFADRFHPSDPTPAALPPANANVRTIRLTGRIPFFPANQVLPAHLLAPMNNAADDEEPVFCVEDTVGLKDDRFSVGIVDRSFGDVDSHSPHPQRDYSEEIERHRDVPRAAFRDFMRTGIPPRGTVLVSWQQEVKEELIPETRLQLLDRVLVEGDVVKRSVKDAMSGTVIGTRVQCTLFPATLYNGGQLTPAISEDWSVRNVPTEELINVHEYVEGAIVAYNNWMGRIEDVYDEVAVKLSNNSVVVVENPDDLENDDAMLDRLSVGDTVKTKKGNLRRGHWRYGAFDPTIRPEGMVVETRPVHIDVQWLGRRIGASATAADDEPPSRLFRDQLESENFHVYDASRAAAATLPTSADGTGRKFHVAEVTVGDRVRFKDIDGAAAKYDGTKNLPNGYPQGKLTRIPRAETLGYDLNVFLVMQTHTQVTVQWQDLSITEHASQELIPDPNIGDEDEVWPGELVCTKARFKGTSDDVAWTFRPAKVGIVQSVKSRDRIATVKWFQNPLVQFLDEDAIPPIYTGPLGHATEDVSLYDIKSSPSLGRRLCDIVLVHPGAYNTELLPVSIKGPTWFGEVINLGLDGKITVRLGAANPVVDVPVSIEDVTLAYNGDMDEEMVPDGHDESIDEGSDEDYEYEDQNYQEIWIEYGTTDGSVPPVEGNEEDWSTEDSDDESMPDLESKDPVPTSNTTPDVLPDAEQKAPSAEEIGTSTAGVATTAPADHMAKDTHPSSPSIDGQETPPDHPPAFLILDTPPPDDHHFVRQTAASSSTFMRRIAKEHKILRSSLPPGIFVRTWESRLDLLRVLMIGPSDTPYEYAPFLIDLHLDSTYPQSPPAAFFHSWTYGHGPVNPNLYEDGKICLSLLGTWHTDERNESWSPTKSTLLQVLVSIMGLVLVKDPYYNEAGYDVHRATPETKLSSALYTERSYFRARGFIAYALTNEVKPFQDELHALYRRREEGRPNLLDRAIQAAKEVLERSVEKDGDEERDGLRKVSLGATVMLRREVERLEGLREEQGGE